MKIEDPTKREHRAFDDCKVCRKTMKKSRRNKLTKVRNPNPKAKENLLQNIDPFCNILHLEKALTVRQ